ncbi:MAG: WecB/TagA/CpsF family glycosyltransferase [Candidatus Dadabacteria bacterium]|nr:MAG: WecB/TagA/CpsF family glycosyltransferase [Candidatus Dadabacteria bacterium]
MEQQARKLDPTREEYDALGHGVPACPAVTDVLAAHTHASVAIADIQFADLDYRQATRTMERLAMGDDLGHFVVLANAHTINLALSDSDYHAILRRACVVLRDGIGISIAARLFGGVLHNNFVGTDFVPAFLGDLAPRRPRVFLYGARPGRAETAARVLAATCPGVDIVGCEHGYVRACDVVGKIADLEPHLLLVALGNPLQERWIAENIEASRAHLAIGVGALFDYLAGAVPRAPAWVRAARFEWLYRLAVEPRRLWRRYILGNPVFLSRIAARAAAERLRSSQARQP